VIELTVRRFGGSKWHVGWPYKLVPGEGYQLPDAEHETLVEWWRRNYIDRPGGHKSLAAVLDAVDLAVRREAPPVPFKLRRPRQRDEIVRDYPATPVSGEAA
jgi:hypothetical protein